ncbi:HAMP domain-containing protein [Paenibacillus sp. SI8]|uniref:sensor histidine kinase n=1 Tax=unclassified Paenibacillus TaxID=185978 RepID=UPI0034661698
MIARIGHWPLSIKLWGAFAALTLFIFTLLAVLLPWTLKGFFTEQLYDILLDTQSGLQVEQGQMASPALRLSTPIRITSSSIIQESVPSKQFIVGFKGSETEPSDTMTMPDAAFTAQIMAPLEGPAIRHFMISENGLPAATIPSAEIGEPFIQAMEKDAFTQIVPVEKYTRSIDNKSIFYVIRKEIFQGKPNFIVSYAWGNYRNDLVMTMFGRLMLLMVGLIVISWLPCLALARYFTRPLVQMERHVGRLAERDWHEPLETGRKDEIGRLANAIDSMRQRLIRQDRAQQFFLQHTSHELKTPVMVILSYAQSIQDGVFPKGTLNDSVNVILTESERLEKRIRDLLLLNKLNYLTAREKPFQPFDLQKVLDDVVERLRYRRPEIRWDISTSPRLQMNGDAEQWKVALENILDNQLRYASTCIRITVKPVTAVSQPRKQRQQKHEMQQDEEQRDQQQQDQEQQDHHQTQQQHTQQQLDHELLRYEQKQQKRKQQQQQQHEAGSSSFNQPILRIGNDGPPLDQAIADNLFEPFRSGGDGQFGLGLAIVKQITEHHGMAVRAVNEDDGVAFYIEPKVNERVKEREKEKEKEKEKGKGKGKFSKADPKNEIA